MNVSKKQLKEQVSNNLTMLEVRVKRSFVYVYLSAEVEGVRYWAFDFSKWATEDMRSVHKATRVYQRMMKANCGCSWCRGVAKQLAAFIEKYNWSEEKGIAIATGRAVADIVRQIIEVQKSNSGQIDWEAVQKNTEIPLLTENPGGEVPEFGFDKTQIKYARSKVNPGKML